MTLMAKLILLVMMVGAWNPFVYKIEKVEKGNSALKEKKYEEALDIYTKALENHGDRIKLHFNQGLAFLALKNYPEAEKKFIKVTGDDNLKLRSRANYFTGISRFHQGEKLLKEKKSKEAENKYREAADNFKRVLLNDPEDENARFNFELTMERIEDIEKQRDKKQKKKEEQEKKKKDQQKKDQQKKDQQKKNQQKKDQQKKDQQKKDQQKKDQQKKDQQKKDQQKKDQQKKDQQKKQQQKKQQQKKQQQKKQQSGKKMSPQKKAAVKALKDLKERQRKRLKQLYRKMGKKRRTPIKDW